MAYDEGLAERVRTLVEDERKITEKRMFGGIAFLVDDKMFVGVSRERLLVRVGKVHQVDALELPHVSPMVMGERTAQGFVYVEPIAVDREVDLDGWVRPALAYARSLPAKKKPAAKSNSSPNTRNAPANARNTTANTRNAPANTRKSSPLMKLPKRTARP